MKALVTGGTGFIGSHLVRHLCKRGYEVSVISRLSSKNFQKIPKIKYIYADLTHMESLEALPRDFDYVFHVAALRDSAGKKKCFATNVQGTEHLLKVLFQKPNSIKKLIYVSSLGAAGFSKSGRP